jgi:hypothetical protein
MGKRALLLGLLAAFAGALSSCATLADMQVASMAKAPLARGQSFKIVPASDKADPEALVFLLGADYLGRALKQKGWVPVAEGAAPDFVVKLGFGYGKPDTQLIRGPGQISVVHFYPLRVFVSARDVNGEAWRTELIAWHDKQEIRFMLPRVIAMGSPDLGTDIERKKELQFDPERVDPDAILPK